MQGFCLHSGSDDKHGVADNVCDATSSNRGSAMNQTWVSVAILGAGPFSFLIKIKVQDEGGKRLSLTARYFNKEHVKMHRLMISCTNNRAVHELTSSSYNGKYSPQNMGTVANVAPKPRKQPLQPSFLRTSERIVRSGACCPLCMSPHTCILVRIKSRGAQTTLASAPLPTPANKDDKTYAASRDD